MGVNKEKSDCFAYHNQFTCHALLVKECNKCKFYKPRNAIKNNPYYPFSYDSLEKYERDIQDRGFINL